MSTAGSAIPTDIETFAFWERPHHERLAAFKWLRENDPVSWHPPAESLLLPPEANRYGFWAVTRHADIVEASRNKNFQSGQGVFMEDIDVATVKGALSFLVEDQPRHTELRGIVQSAFSPANVRKIDGWIRQHAHDLVAEMAPEGAADVVTRLSKVLPGLIFAHYVGVTDDEMRDRTVHAADQLGSWNDPAYTQTMTPMEVFGSAAQTLAATALELAALRRVEPGDDVVSWLVQTEFEGERMTDHDIASFFVLLSGASNDTTGHAISHSLIELQRHPEQKAWLLEDFEGRIDNAVEELLRWRPPIIHFRRTAREDCTLGGAEIKAGDKVVLWYESGNFDDTIFDDPFTLDLTRRPNRHLAFGGGGIHFCLGSALGRQLLKCALREVYTQLPDFEIQEPKVGFSNIFNSMRHLPATWTVS
ncbi:cytochrome P450 [Patulibacter minatonensis]|uniref:cytochrome P450 n=1 Tax=Patulibacter minatonensis TaxID=298163 RepID=UPI00047DD39D|nr:cytochrome P450 [Patulibacter minatonensis]